MRPFVCLLPLTVGCAPPLAGTWSGLCEIEKTDLSETYDVLELVLERSADGVSGPASVRPNWQDFEGTVEPFTGTAEGTSSGGEVSLLLSLGDVTQGFALSFEGSLAGDVIEGTCTAEVDEPVSGTGRLERAPSE